MSNDKTIPRDVNSRQIILPEEMGELSDEEKVVAENKYADRHEFSSRD